VQWLKKSRSKIEKKEDCGLNRREKKSKSKPLMQVTVRQTMLSKVPCVFWRGEEGAEFERLSDIHCRRSWW
jgi:hypothetical protein